MAVPRTEFRAPASKTNPPPYVKLVRVVKGGRDVKSGRPSACSLPQPVQRTATLTLSSMLWLLAMTLIIALRSTSVATEKASTTLLSNAIRSVGVNPENPEKSDEYTTEMLCLLDGGAGVGRAVGSAVGDSVGAVGTCVGERDCTLPSEGMTTKLVVLAVHMPSRLRLPGEHTPLKYTFVLEIVPVQFAVRYSATYNTLMYC